MKFIDSNTRKHYETHTEDGRLWVLPESQYWPTAPQDIEVFSAPSYDLRQMKQIEIISTHEEDQRRNDAQARKSRTTNLLLGAAVGAVLDGSEGDDSVLDGALLGGAVGGAMSSGKSHKEPKARVNAIFYDQSTITLLVTRDELASLHGFLSTPATEEGGPTHQSSTPAPKGLQQELRDRQAAIRNTLLLIAPFVVAMGLIMVPFMVGLMSPEEGTPDAGLSGMSSLIEEIRESAQGAEGSKGGG